MMKEVKNMKEEIKKILDKEAKVYTRQASRGERQIPKSVVEALKEKHAEIGKFTIPIATLHSLIGSKAKTAQRENLMRKLNKQYPIEGKKWYIGVSGDCYIIDIRES